MGTKTKQRKKLSPFQIIPLGFAAVILVGALLLCLPIASRARAFTPFPDALFTAASAACVTGLVVVDTATYWSAFGQVVILLLIQAGGMGVVTVAISFAMLSGRKIGLFGRDTMKESISAPSVGGIVRHTGFILKGIFLAECAGALLLMPAFCRDFGARGIWFAVFHSVSAFCNAGFDIMGSESGAYSSLTNYAGRPLVNVVIMLLIFTGGIGFLTWSDMRTNKWRIGKYSTQSKVILLVSGILILLPACYFFLTSFRAFPLGERIWMSLFQSVTTRTAGFNTADLTAIGETGQALMIVLMLIGGSPGSTAGGMKTTTIAVLCAAALSVFSQKNDVAMLRRRVDSETVKSAAAVLLSYFMLFFVGGAVIAAAEGLPLSVSLFEAASAVGTVGLSLGVTPTLHALSRVILMLLMFFGRVGVLTLVYAAHGKSPKSAAKYPVDFITVG